MIYDLAQSGARLLMALAADVRVSGRENFPADGNCIIATNHLTAWDTPLIFSIVPRRWRVVVLAAEKWHKVLPIRWVFDGVGCVWVRRGEVDRQALAEVMTYLKNGRVVGMAPEGTRSKTGALQKARNGAAWLARASGAPIIPVALWGVENIRVFHRPEVQVRVGAPLRLTREDNLDEATERIMRQIAQMLPEKYRGVYE
ncbi:MAG TPA: lysophospholipid acyltransferase family protein [Thermoflexales bacterium]|nr:lysophospholipid acyltransferase family protein [Thermoflexales bacterium]HQW34845.1 lysophospholipid acyltransferase family protein [Thermoflexales bacterium]HQZ22336.1 lysophospholipid acyltransferase family protein [Thermoflexales bacterium]